jgi:hypothetical protein
MSRALGEAHRRYTNFINARGRWTVHLFQSRFRVGRHGRVAPEVCGIVSELERRLGRPIAHRAPGRKTVAIPVGEQLNLLQ